MFEKIIEKSNILVSATDLSFVRNIYDEIDWSQKLI
jgi:hypothetical protein